MSDQSLRQRVATALRVNATALHALALHRHGNHAGPAEDIKVCDDIMCEEHMEVRAETLGVLEELESPADLDQSFEPDEETVERICAWLATRARYRGGVAALLGTEGDYEGAIRNQRQSMTLSDALLCIKDGCPFTPRSRWE